MSADIETFKQWCIDAEASSNHGDSSDIKRFSTVDWRRGICFWGDGRGWQLFRDWRAQWAITFPHVELPPAPPPKPRIKYVSQKKLYALWKEYKSLDTANQSLWWDDKERCWMCDEIKHDNEGQAYYEESYVGANTNEAYKVIQRCIAKYLKAHGLSGQEPQLGGQAERTGLEPMIGESNER